MRVRVGGGSARAVAEPDVGGGEREEGGAEGEEEEVGHAGIIAETARGG